MVLGDVGHNIEPTPIVYRYIYTHNYIYIYILYYVCENLPTYVEKLARPNAVTPLYNHTSPILQLNQQTETSWTHDSTMAKPTLSLRTPAPES